MFLCASFLIKFCGFATLYMLLKFFVVTHKQISKITFVVTGYSEAVKTRAEMCAVIRQMSQCIKLPSSCNCRL
jgi:hypothetical protein